MKVKEDKKGLFNSGSYFLLFVSILIWFLFFSARTFQGAENEGKPRSPEVEGWVTIYALLKAYGDSIESIEFEDGEPVLIIRGKRLYYAGGRMLSEAHRKQASSFDPIFYPYHTGPLRELPGESSFPVKRSSDFLDALIGSSEMEIRASCLWVPFLDHKAFIHRMTAIPLKMVEARILREAETSMPVRQYIENIRIIFSLSRRRVSGTLNMSYHGYGLAIDIIPKGYGRKHVYWRWSSAFDPGWGRIPLEKRWQPPLEVIEAFEENGFVWGGKWYHFDSVHFEYRPEIILLSNMGFQ
ncbi:MAG: M15 family metallopeptidase [Spirochaetota bacterium]